MKNPLTPAGIEPATFRFVAQHLNHCATAVPKLVHLVGFITSIYHGARSPERQNSRENSCLCQESSPFNSIIQAAAGHHTE